MDPKDVKAASDAVYEGLNTLSIAFSTKADLMSVINGTMQTMAPVFRAAEAGIEAAGQAGS